MPVALYFKNVGEPPSPCYTSSLAPWGPHSPSWTPEPETIEHCKNILKNLARDIDSFNKTKKELEKEKNYEVARYYRDLISDFTKQHRAYKLALGWFLDEPGLPWRRMVEWSIELEKELDMALGVLSLTKEDIYG